MKTEGSTLSQYERQNRVFMFSRIKEGEGQGKENVILKL